MTSIVEIQQAILTLPREISSSCNDGWTNCFGRNGTNRLRKTPRQAGLDWLAAEALDAKRTGVTAMPDSEITCPSVRIP